VWTFPPGATLTPTKVSTGYVIGPVAAIDNNGTLIVFGKGYGGALWYATRNGHAWTTWTSLGGIVSYPAAVYRGLPGLYSVFVRGADGAVWARDHSASGWKGWHRLGGLLYANTGPSGGYASGTYVLVVGQDRQLWIEHAGATGFVPVGGQTTASPALTSVGGALVGFVPVAWMAPRGITSSDPTPQAGTGSR
jgi:hypothetical protein